MSESKRRGSIPYLLLKTLFGHRSESAPREVPQRSMQLHRPTSDDRNTWRAYWQAQGLAWRTEPEIDRARQEYLARCRLLTPNIKQGIYPFKCQKLSRADVEWLLATHVENRHGTVNWNQQEYTGVDLRGADLRQVNLKELPLAGVQGGLIWRKEDAETTEQREGAAVYLSGADLSRADLRGANLRFAHLEGANLYWAHLERADLNGTHLEGANLYWAHLERAYLNETHLERADLRRVRLSGAKIENITLNDEEHIGPRIADIHWSDVNLAIVKWSQVNMLGDEHEARQKMRNGKVKDRVTRLDEHEMAARANRQVAVALQTQGLNEDAARFAYRAQVLQKRVLCFQMLQHGVKLRQRGQAFGAWLFSWFLFLLAGYGYRVWRSFAAYVLVIGGFATAYYLLGPTANLSLSPLDAIIFSVTSFHGRGFSPGENIGLSNPLTILAAIEAFVGLVIEVTLIATLTQRFFGR